MKTIFGILLFIFFLIVFFLILAGGYIIKTIRKFRQAARQAAEEQEQRYRNETGRQSRQYTQRHQATQQGGQSRQGQYRQQGAAQQETCQTRTATGETIIDHRRQERESKKIFDDSDGEYVEFTEEA